MFYTHETERPSRRPNMNLFHRVSFYKILALGIGGGLLCITNNLFKEQQHCFEGLFEK
jgi:hypothetical protein